MGLKDIVGARRFRDTLSMFTLDVKLGPDGFKIIEVGEPGCGIDDRVERRLIASLNDVRFNPLLRPVDMLVHGEYHDFAFKRGLVRVTTKKDDFVGLSPGPGGVNWENYDRIIVDRKRNGFTVPEQPFTFLVNGSPFDDIGHTKAAGLACLGPYTSLARSFGSLEELEEVAVEFEGKDVVLKSCVGSCSIGIRFVGRSTPGKLVEVARSFDVSSEYPGWESLAESEREAVQRDYFPNVVHEYVEDVPVMSGLTAMGHVSVDRVGVLVKSCQGELDVKYLGGFHRFDKLPHPSERRPICLAKRTAFRESFTPDYEEGLREFVCEAMLHFYSMALGLPKDFYFAPPEVVNGKALALTDYLAA